MRGRFFRRFGCLFSLFFVLIVGGIFGLLWMLANLLGVVRVPAGGVQTTPVGAGGIFLLALAILLVGVRLLRRTAVPVGDLLEAAGRIADGDYSVRLAERGPREVRALSRAYNLMASRLQSGQQSRRDLLADVTHELRTPITVIQGSLEGMMDGIYPADQTHLESILEETRVLSRVIEDLRTLSLAESGALRLQVQPTDLGELIRETVSLFDAQAQAAGVSLRVDSGEEIPVVEVDPTRIREVLSNLLSNATRYTPGGGGICVRVDRPDPKSIRVAVSDTGSGISTADLPHVFDRFYKTSDSRGSGLGLAIAKSLVTAHGGEITAGSEPGKGTQIAFRLPVR